MIGTAGIVPHGFRSPCTQEDRAGIFQIRNQGPWLHSLDNQVLGGILIGNQTGLGQILTNNTQA